jgi:hypothetical protein
MNRRNITVILIAVAFSALVTAAFSWRARIAEAELRSRMASQADRLASESIRRVRLREALKKSAGASENKNALLRLRAEVADLRRGIADVNALKDGLEKLKQEVAATTNRPTDLGPDPSKVRAYWSKDEISFAGCSDQTSAVQSCLWAMSRGDENKITEVMDPSSIKQLWRDSRPDPSEADKNGTSPDALAERRSNLHRLAESLAPVTGFYLVSDNLIEKMPEQKGYRTAQTDAVFKVYFAGDGATRAIWLTKSNGEWKLKDVVVLGGTEEKPSYNMTLWP